ncbi:MAG: hypothetical protein OHK005_17070 [Candidatus Methylacidiphilales bacterium]
MNLRVGFWVGIVGLMVWGPDAVVGAERSRVLYLYGDVSAEGDVPSGEKEPFHQMRLSDTGDRGLSQFRDALAAVGVEVQEAYDASVTLTEAFLRPVRGLILGSNQRRFTADEVTAVRKWVEAGGGLVAWSDSAFGGHFAKVGVDNPKGRDSNNDLTAQFGMFFLTDNGAGNYLVERYTEPHYLNAGNPNGGIRFRGEGVSPVRVSPPARMLAPLQEGGLGGGLRVNRVDEPFDPDRDAALAIAEVGQGRVVGTFDRNTFWNAGEGTRLSHVDNRAFAQRLVLWAIQAEATPLDKSGAAGAGPAVAAWEVMVGPDVEGLVGTPIPLQGSLRGTGQLRPEVNWVVVEGDKSQVTFANNNPAALETWATFSRPGTYRLRLVTRSGQTEIGRDLTVTVREP